MTDTNPSLHECSIVDCCCYSTHQLSKSQQSSASFCFPPIDGQSKLVAESSYLCDLHIKLLEDFIEKATQHYHNTTEEHFHGDFHSNSSNSLRKSSSSNSFNKKHNRKGSY